MRLKFKSVVAQSPKYRPEIDGLRAIAILPVVLYHAGVSCFSGGFVGVDIFFVISGYLITSIIAKDIQQNRFSFVSFYERRIRRIFPALFAVAFFTVIVAAVLLVPNDYKDFGRSLMAMTVFASNLYFRKVGDQDGYFGSKTESEPLLHTWSLAVEEQFYIFFPIGLILLHRYAKKHEKLCLLLIALASFGISAWGAIHKPLGAFYLLPPRAWELLIGAFLALKMVPPLSSRPLREAAGLLGIALIGYAIFVFTKDTTFPGANALFPCLGAGLIIYASEGGDCFAKRALSFAPLVFIGVISYSLYLWHWPLIVFMKRFLAHQLYIKEIVAVITASLILAFLSFEFIESPFRDSKTGISQRQIFIFGILASVVLLVLAVAIYLSNGLPQRYSGVTKVLVLKNAERPEDYIDVCKNFKKDIHRVDDIEYCKINYNPNKNILFLGDSHLQQLYPLVKKLSSKNLLNNRGAVFSIGAACPLFEHLNRVIKGFHCDQFTHYAMVRAEQDDIDTVFIAFAVWWDQDDGICTTVNGHCDRILSRKEVVDTFLKELSQHIAVLKEHGKKVIVSLPFPTYMQTIPDLEIRNAIFGKIGDKKGAAQEIDHSALREQIEQTIVKSGATIFDPRFSLCRNGNCVYEKDGVSIYKDDNHLAASQIDILEDNMLETLQKAQQEQP